MLLCGRHDTPDAPLAFDGYSLLHGAYGIIGGWILGMAGLTDAEVILIIALGAVVWELVENGFPAFFGPLFGLSDYTGDSGLNSVVDVLVGVAGGCFGLYVPEPASYITGFVLLVAGLIFRFCCLGSAKTQPLI